MEKEFLYHYTSLENLALILKNRTIRLNTLDKMDDLQEQKTSDILNFGRFFFVSSWTSDKTESIPMWKMYTSPGNGVRIGLRKNPFKRNPTTGSDFLKIPGMFPQDKDSNAFVQDTFLNLAEVMSKGVYCAQAWGGEILHKVIYTDDKSLLEPCVNKSKADEISISFSELGKYKNKYWEFQEEWRYLLSFIPMDFTLSPENMYKKFNQTALKILNGTEALPFNYYDLHILDECFGEMEIIPSPTMTAGNKIILQSIVEKYNPTATMYDSALLGLI